MSDQTNEKPRGTETMEIMEDIIDILNERDAEGYAQSPSTRGEASDDSHSDSDYSAESSSGEFSGKQSDEYGTKLLEVIASLQNHDYLSGDDWEDDQDTGYTTMTLTEEQFYDFEHRNLAKRRREEAAKLQVSSVQSSPYRAPDMPSPQAVTSSPSVDRSSSSSSRKSTSSTSAPPSPLPASTVTESATSLPSEGDVASSVAAATAVPAVQAAAAAVAVAEEIANELADGTFGVLPKDGYVPTHRDPFQIVPDDINNTTTVNHRRQSVGERRRSEIIGQHRFHGVDGDKHCYFNLKVIFEPYKTGFEETKDFKHPRGTIIAGRYEVCDVLGTAAFSTALQCFDLAADPQNGEAECVCLKVIKNNKDYFDQSLDEIKLLQYINSRGDPDAHFCLRLIDYFYYKEHLFIVSELLKENLYEFGRFIREHGLEVYYTLPRLKRIAKQVLSALDFIHRLNLIHCDVKPENIVIKSFSRCEVKLIDFGSSCFTSDHKTTYIQSRSYRAPDVILGHDYDGRIDIWSVGAVMAELFTDYVLFQNDSVPTMISRITGILGPFPSYFLADCRDAHKYFTSTNIVYERNEEQNSFQLIFPKRTTLYDRLHISKPEPGSVARDEDLFVDFVRALLDLDCDARPTAAQALQHAWLADADTVQFSEYAISHPKPPEGEYEGEQDLLDGNTYEQDEEYEEEAVLDEYGTDDQSGADNMSRESEEGQESAERAFLHSSSVFEKDEEDDDGEEDEDEDEDEDGAEDSLEGDDPAAGSDYDGEAENEEEGEDTAEEMAGLDLVDQQPELTTATETEGGESSVDGVATDDDRRVTDAAAIALAENADETSGSEGDGEASQSQ